MAGSNLAGTSISITGADADHIRVLRMRLGERLVICDGSGTDRRCRLTRLGDGYAEAEVEETVPCPAEPSVSVTVLAGLPKGDRGDYLVQKCTEAGAVRIAFFQCERCVARVDERGAEKKAGRWQRIAEEAAKQCGRGIIPKVQVLPDLASALEIAISTELPLLMYETGRRVPLRQAIENYGSFSTASVITGPEGGFEPYEVELAARLGIQVCSMGERILRCETAPVVALSALMYATDNL
jgi:16S rRNA (uracil1498-N3)-methyltransferase